MNPSPAGKAVQPWQAAIVGLHGLWHDAKSATALLDELPHSVRRTLETRSQQRGGELLSFARGVFESFPYRWVHSSWIESVAPSDPLVRGWIDSLVPADLGLRTVEQSVQPSGVMPPWFGDWWRKRLEGELGYPWLVPGEVDARRPVTHVFLYSSEELESILGVYGLRLVAAAIYGLDRGRIIDELYGFPPTMADRIVALVREREFPMTEAWTTIYERLHDEIDDPGARARELALVDIGQFCRRGALRNAAHRLALRLSRPMGLRLLGRMDVHDHDPIDLEVADVWHDRWRRDIKDMVGQGFLAPLVLDGELL